MAFGAQIRGPESTTPQLLAAMHEGTQSGMEVLGVKGEEMVRENIATPFNGLPPAVCFGNLAGSITSQFQWLPDAALEIVGVSPQMGADRYAPAVETGAVPHMPPVDALLPWVAKKFDVEDEKQARSIAFAVAMKIKKRGTGGHQMFSRALEALEPLAVPVLEQQIAMALGRHGFVGLA